MSDERKCPSCGARMRRLDERFCGFCGTEVPLADGPVVVHAGPHGDLEARFRALREHPDLDALLRRAPTTSGPAFQYGCLILFGCLFAAVALVITGGFGVAGFAAGRGAGAGWLSLFPLVFVAIGVGIVVYGIRKAARYAAAPLQRIPVLVVDERIRVSGGGRNSSASTTYYASLQTEPGRRFEVQTSGSIAGRITEGDLGVAYVKADQMVDFRRVDV